MDEEENIPKKDFYKLNLIEILIFVGLVIFIFIFVRVPSLVFILSVALYFSFVGFHKYHFKRKEKKYLAQQAEIEILEENKKNEEIVLEEFLNMDVLSLYVIANLLGEIKLFELKAIETFPKIPHINLSIIIFSFLKDIRYIENFDDLKNIYTEFYYKNKFTILIPNTEKILKEEIISNTISIDYKDKLEKYNLYLSKLFLTIKENRGESYHLLQYSYFRFSEKEIPSTPLSYNYQKYKYIEDYVTTLFQNISMITKVYFVSRIASKVDEESEFYKILKNINSQDIDYTQEKEEIENMYLNFYSDDLGKINEDYWIQFLTKVIKSKILNKDESQKKEYSSDDKKNVSETTNIRIWIHETVQEGNFNDIEKRILYKILQENNDDFESLIVELSQFNYYYKMYKEEVDQYKLDIKREKFLIPDFKIDLYEKYNMGKEKITASPKEFQAILKALYIDFKVRYKHDIKESENDIEIKADMYMQFIAEYAETIKYDLLEGVESLLLKYKKILNAWDYVFDWKVKIIVDKKENYFNEGEDIDTQILRFIDNSEKFYKFDTDIRNYEDTVKEIENDILKLKKKG